MLCWETGPSDEWLWRQFWSWKWSAACYGGDQQQRKRCQTAYSSCKLFVRAEPRNVMWNLVVLLLAWDAKESKSGVRNDWKPDLRRKHYEPS